jgi:hypothetical protein
MLLLKLTNREKQMTEKWQVIDSTSSVMRDHKKVLFRCETLEEASNWKKVNHAGQDNIRIRTKPEARVKTEDEKF